MKKYIVLVFLLIISKSNNAGIGCMKKSKDMDRTQGPDFKLLHYVCCTCPCDDYKIIQERSRCSMCRHYRMITPDYYTQPAEAEMVIPRPHLMKAKKFVLS